MPDERETFRPSFMRSRPVTTVALAFAGNAHRGERREGDGAPFILHPIEVAAMLSAWGCRDEVTAAAVLHDTLEDTGATGEQIEARFGPTVARLVRTLTEDEGIADRGARKAALREQVADADRDTAMIYVADKLSKVRELRIRMHMDPSFVDRSEGRETLDHYWRSLDVLGGVLGNHPLVRQLEFELEAVCAMPPQRW